MIEWTNQLLYEARKNCSYLREHLADNDVRIRMAVFCLANMVGD